MANVFEHFQVNYRYDLKGSKKSRDRLPKTLEEKKKAYKEHKQTISLKCNDFRALEQGLQLTESLGPFKDKSLKDIFENDASFLARNGLMDYSLLAGIIDKKADEVRQMCAGSNKGHGVYIDNKNQAWLLGIIDPLNPWDFEKKAEYAIKKSRFGMDMSCVPPQPYKERWVKFMQNGFVSHENSSASTDKSNRMLLAE